MGTEAGEILMEDDETEWNSVVANESIE